ncbi:hypothetical protein H6H01_11800 [Nostoc calcicola FACHB-3891]|nr:hypothetical protein [Nostoc calcicola FACHB-3891]MDZ8063299.1 hypothetical protein [Nostoc sp. EkiNYC01]
MISVCANCDRTSEVLAYYQLYTLLSVDRKVWRSLRDKYLSKCIVVEN